MTSNANESKPRPDDEPGDSRGTGRVTRRRVLEVAETLGLTLLLFFGLQTFVAQPYKVQQPSMETTILPGQYVLVDKLTPRWSRYTRGDIVVFEPPPTWL